MYVEYWIPQDLKHSLPLVLVHGGGGQGLDFLGTADGREGWVHWIVAPGLCRLRGGSSGPWPLAVPSRHIGADDAGAAARLHRGNVLPPVELSRALSAGGNCTIRWPGPGVFGDKYFDNFYASANPAQADTAQAHRDTQAAAAALLDAVGPAILLTHSAGGSTGWLGGGCAARAWSRRSSRSSRSDRPSRNAPAAISPGA